MRVHSALGPGRDGRFGCDFKTLNGSTLGRKSFLNTMTRMRRILRMLRHEIPGAAFNQ